MFVYINKNKPNNQERICYIYEKFRNILTKRIFWYIILSIVIISKQYEIN